MAKAAVVGVYGARDEDNELMLSHIPRRDFDASVGPRVDHQIMYPAVVRYTDDTGRHTVKLNVSIMQEGAHVQTLASAMRTNDAVVIVCDTSSQTGFDYFHRFLELYRQEGSRSVPGVVLGVRAGAPARKVDGATLAMVAAQLKFTYFELGSYKPQPIHDLFCRIAASVRSYRMRLGLDVVGDADDSSATLGRLRRVFGACLPY